MNEKNESPKNLQTALDCAARDFEGKKGGYVINDVSYLNYMTNEDWKSFCDGIAENHKKQFKKGSGGELNGKNNVPPKMASYGSSSRLIYELSKDIEDFSFEKQLHTYVGGIANLDGFLQKQSEYIYVESKKREIYGKSHKGESINKKYLDVYYCINKVCSSFKFKYHYDDKKADYSKVTFQIGDNIVEYFDLKQLICHFLGITYYIVDIVKHNIQRANVSFLYLLYNPNEIKVCIDEKYREKILERYGEVQKMISENIENGFFNKVFDAILDYQVEKHDLNKPEISFKMELVDQNNYRERIESK